MARPTAPDDTKQLAQATILVVDDSQFVVDLLTRMLRHMPVANILTAPSAEDAFYNLEKNHALADVMILDHGLRGMDGLRFLEKLRSQKNENLRRLPVVVLTGHNDMELYQQMAEQRVSAFLVKPVSHDVLKAALERALQGYLVPKPRLTGELPAPPAAEGRVSPRTARAAAPEETGGPEKPPESEDTDPQSRKGKKRNSRTASGKVDIAV